MDVQHDLSGPLAVQVEEGFEHDDDEIHRREIVVEQDDLVERRPRDLRSGLLQDEAGAMFRAPVGLLAHEP